MVQDYSQNASKVSNNAKQESNEVLKSRAYVEDSCAIVVKFFVPSRGHMSQDTERAAHMMIEHLSKGSSMLLPGFAPQNAAKFVSEHTPPILAVGQLYDPHQRDVRDFKKYVEGNRWPYLIQPYIHGQSMQQHFPSDCDPFVMIESAEFLGKYLKNLHQIMVGVPPLQKPNPLYNGGWAGFTKTLIKRRRAASQNGSEALSSALQQQIDDYLPRDVRKLFTWYQESFKLDHPRLLHGDLNDENVFIRDGKPCTVIDFGDCLLGDPQYDWVPLFVSCLRCHKSLLITFFMEYYNARNFDHLSSIVGGWDRFTYTMMCYSLLHEQDALRTAFYHRPELKNHTSLRQLAKDLWDLSC